MGNLLCVLLNIAGYLVINMFVCNVELFSSKWWCVIVAGVIFNTAGALGWDSLN